MSKELDTGKDPDHEPDLTRRHLGVGLLAALGGGLGAVDVTVDNPDLRLSLRVGGKIYNLVNGDLVLEQRNVS